MLISSGGSHTFDPYRVSYREDAEMLRDGGVYDVDGGKNGKVTLDTRYNTVKVGDSKYTYNPASGELTENGKLIVDADDVAGGNVRHTVAGTGVVIDVHRGMPAGHSDVLSLSVTSPRGNGGYSTLTLKETFTCDDFPDNAASGSDLDIDCGKSVSGQFTADDDNDPNNGTAASEDITFADNRGRTEKFLDWLFSV